jgi:hypothetical protein
MEFESLTNLIAVLLIILPAMNLFVAWKLHRASQVEHITALEERKWTAFVLWLASSAVALLGISRINYLVSGEHLLEPPLVLFLMALAMILISVPSLYWYYLYIRRRFGE